MDCVHRSYLFFYAFRDVLFLEAQDDGVVAKIIVEAGGGEIPCGT